MDKESYIVIGVCIFTFLLGLKLKKWLSKKPIEAPKVHKSQRSKMAKQALISPKPQDSKFPRIKVFFLWLQVVVLFSVIIFMVPSISRDLMLSDGHYDQKLILRILIVAFTAYTLFIGVNKVLKRK